MNRDPQGRLNGSRGHDDLGRKRRRLKVISLALVLVSATAEALAQSAAPGAIILDEIIVTAPENVLEKRINALPGGADLVLTEDLPDTANLTVSRALASVPGVIVQNFFGGNDQPRIQIRGSGLQQNPVERGVLILQDGLPVNRADGSYVVGLANPRQAAAIEVYRGHLANRLGATVFGGALNFISPTGRSAPDGKFSLGGGSFGQFSALGQYGFNADHIDGLLQADINRRDGYRVYNDSRRIRIGGNLGLRLNENVQVRFFASYTDLGFDVSGPLTETLLKTDPKSVFTGPTITPMGVMNPGPNVVRDQPRRDTEQLLIGSRATMKSGDHILDLAVGYAWTDDSFRFPIPAGIRSTRGEDVTGVLRYAYKPDAASVLPLFELTAQYVTGSADRDYYLNLSGARGARFASNKLDADTLSLSAGFHIPIGEFTVSPSIAYSRATRDSEDVYDAATRPTAAYNPRNPDMRLPDGAVPALNTSYARTYDGWSPAFGLTWEANDDHLLFVAVSRSFEPPTHDDLLATINGTPNSSAGRPNPGNPALPAPAFSTPDLKAQRATTLEAGWRGQEGIFRWDMTIYYSWVKNELLNLRDETGASLGAVNAGRTRRLGVELGVSAYITTRLVGQIVYNYQDFRFRNDPVRGNNRLAGAPRHWLHAMLDYSLTDDWSAQASIRWMITKTPVDNLNTLFNAPYAVVDLRTAYRISDALSLFGEVTNVFDENYASSTLVVDQARPDQAAFLPGDGRAFYGGITLTF